MDSSPEKKHGGRGRTGRPAGSLRRLAAVAAAAGAAIYCVWLTVASPDGDAVIRNEAVSSFLFKTGQRLIIRSNRTETWVQNASVAASLDLDLSRSALIGNGLDSCLITARVADADGNPVPDGQPVSFVASGGTFPNGDDTAFVLTANGVAETRLRSSVLNGGPVRAAVTGSTLGVGGLWLIRRQTVLIYAGGVVGTLRKCSGLPIAGVPVSVHDSTRQVAGCDTTRADGSYLVPLCASGAYSLLLHIVDPAGDDFDIRTAIRVSVPASGGTQAVPPLNVIAGRLIEGGTGQPFRRSGVPVLLTYTGGSSPPGPGRSSPMLAWTDDRGRFFFDSLSPGEILLQSLDVRNAGQVTVQQATAGLVVIDANIVLSGARGFEISKTCNQRIVEIGDIISYTVEVKNTAEIETLMRPSLSDELPPAFVFARGTARRDGQPLPDPPDNRRLHWSLADSLPPGRTVKVTYAVLVGSGALESDGTNRACAAASTLLGDTIRTAVAAVQVTVRPGLFTDRGIVVGKVFFDADGDGRQQRGEDGIPGVELLMEDGTRVVTGDDGKFSLPEVRPGQHVMRVNPLTLPHGALCLPAQSDFAGDGSSRFIRLTEGGIARADFYVKRPAQASLEARFAVIAPAMAGERINALYVVALSEGTHPSTAALLDSLPAGFSYDPGSVLRNGSPLAAAGNAPGSLLIDLAGLREGTPESVSVTIVADSAAVGKPLVSSGRLLLGYPRGRDAVFAALQRYEPGLARPERSSTAGPPALKQPPAAPVLAAETRIVDSAGREDSARPHVLAAGPPRARSVRHAPQRPAPPRARINTDPAPKAAAIPPAPLPLARVTAIPPASQEAHGLWPYAAGGAVLGGGTAALLLRHRRRKRRTRTRHSGR